MILGDKKHHRQNLYLDFSENIISFVTNITRGHHTNSIEELFNIITNEIVEFENKLLKNGKEPKVVSEVKYCLCTTIDEMIMLSILGKKSQWSQRTLLNYFYKETYGGERFYTILDNFMKCPHSNTNILEFIYTLLSLGYEGKLFNKNENIKDGIRRSVFYHIRKSQVNRKIELESSSNDSGPPINITDEKLSSRKIIIITMALIGVIYISFNLYMISATKITINEINKIAQESPESEYKRQEHQADDLMINKRNS